MQAATIAVFPGDGIGPEVTARGARRARAVRRALRAAARVRRGPDRRRRHRPRRGRRCRAESLRSAQASDAVLLGAVGGPQVGRPAAARCAPSRRCSACGATSSCSPTCGRSSPTRRSIAAAPLKRELLEGVDILFVRELTGGVYFGQPSERRVGPGRARGGRHDASTPRTRWRACAGWRSSSRRRAAQARHAGRQGEHPRHLAPVARGDARGRGGVPGRDAARTSSSTPWRCTCCAARATSTSS